MPLPGDDLVPGATLVFDTVRTLPAPPEAVWPWLLQLGKRRAGWYLPSGIERLLPSARRALWRLDEQHQRVAVGDRIPDYGGRDEHLEARLIDPPRALVYVSRRGAATFSWALLLTPRPGGRTQVHLRFRGRPRSTGWRLRVIEAGGGLFDRLTGELMLAGLGERLQA